jgi:hypothetical protein
VEENLQDMHRIYRFSRITVAVLSKISDSWMYLPSRLSSLKDLSQTVAEVQTTKGMVRSMVDDPWFTRSW